MQFSYHRRRQLLALGASAVTGGLVNAQDVNVDEVMRKAKVRGSLSFGLYNDMAPFHDKGKGIDVELANMLATAMGLKATLLPFEAGENMNDDLRNMVWRGHYLGYGPADVLMHVPVDKPLMDQTPQTIVLAPYYRETLAIARDKSKVAAPIESTKQFAGHKIAVPGQSLAGWLMLGADQGAYKENLTTKLKDTSDAVDLLKQGKVSFAVGAASEIESSVALDSRFAIDTYPGLSAGRGIWAVGMAVKRQATDLARGLQAATNQLTASGELANLFKKFGVTWVKP
jgi:ABC-type amino acid transport substrate-binding protein